MNNQHQQHKQGKFGYQSFNSEGALSKVQERKYSSRYQLGVTCCYYLMISKLVILEDTV